MNYQIISSRWYCAECQEPLRLFFSSRGGNEEHEEFVCSSVTCDQGHELEDLSEILEGSDEEFYAALERGEKVCEVWKAPPYEGGDEWNPG